MSNATHSAPPVARSLLFVPGTRPDRFDKALAAGADAVILDLEDAVPAPDKARAREAIAAWLTPRHPVMLRLNGADSEWFRDDLALCRQPGVAAVLLPKAERAADVAAVLAAGASTVLPLIESAAGFAALAQLAAAPGVQRLVFGSLDFRIDLGMHDAHEDELLAFRSQLVLASRLAGLQAPVDGVTTAIDEPARLRDDVLRARRLGFGGKLCIHPRQVGEVHACFVPTDAQRAWARRVLDAAAASSGAAVAVDGEMVDTPVILRAQAILRDAGSDYPA
jgi:citrate lyase subunit beta/citryl-CoA lyase